MTRAEELSLKAYPVCPSCLSESNGDGDRNHPRRLAFIEGYEQAEKGIKEWIEGQLAILDKQTLLHPDDDVFWGQRNAYKQMKDKLNSFVADTGTPQCVGMALLLKDGTWWDGDIKVSEC